MSSKLAIHDLSLRCGDCIHYKGSAHPSMGSVCHDLGVSAAAPAPDCYAPNFGVLRTLGNDTWSVLAMTIAGLSPQQMRVFMSALQKAGRLEKYGFGFLQTAYFLAGSEDVVNNYARGFVLGVSAGPTIALVGDSWLRSPATSVIAYLDPRSILSSSDWKARRNSLISRGRISATSRPTPQVNVNYEPPSLDSTDLDLESLAKRSKGQVKRATNSNSKYLEVNLQGGD